MLSPIEIAAEQDRVLPTICATIVVAAPAMLAEAERTVKRLRGAVRDPDLEEAATRATGTGIPERRIEQAPPDAPSLRGRIDGNVQDLALGCQDAVQDEPGDRAIVAASSHAVGMTERLADRLLAPARLARLGLDLGEPAAVGRRDRAQCLSHAGVQAGAAPARRDA